MLCLVLCHLALLGHQVLYLERPAPEADAMVEHARRLAVGEGTLFDPGAGAPTSSWLLVVAASVAAQQEVEPLVVLQTIGMLAAHALLLALFLVTRSEARVRSLWTLLLAPGLLALAPPVAVASTSGLEWSAFAFLVFVAVARFANHDLNLDGEVAVWLLLAVLVRPEGLLVAALVVLWHLREAARAGAAGRGRSWVGVAVIAAALAGLLALHARFGPGPLVPVAFLPGVGSGLAPGQVLDRVRSLPSAIDASAWALVVPVAVAAVVMWRSPLIRAALAFGGVSLLLAGCGGPAPGAHRRLLVGLAFGLLVAQEGYAWLVQRMLQAGVPTRRVLAVMATMPSLLALVWLAHGPAVRERWPGWPAAPASGPVSPAPGAR